MNAFLIHLTHYWLLYAVLTSTIWGVYGCLWVFKPGEPIQTFHRIFTYVISFIKNFACSLLGWVILGILCDRYIQNVLTFTLSDLVLFVLMVLGLTGNLLHATFGTVKTFVHIGDVAAEFIRIKSGTAANRN